MKTMAHITLAAGLLWTAVPASAAADKGELTAVHGICSDAEAKIQTEVLDPLLGPDRAYVFLEAEAELRYSSEKQSKSGRGSLHKAKGKPEDEAKKGDRDAMREQTASQEKKSASAVRVFKVELSSIRLRILHDEELPAKALKEVKKALLALYPGRLKAEDIIFVAAPFAGVAGGDPADRG